MIKKRGDLLPFFCALSSFLLCEFNFVFLKVIMKLPDLSKTPKIDKVGVCERVNRFCKRSIKTSAKAHALHLALSMIDFTTLEG